MVVMSLEPKPGWSLESKFKATNGDGRDFCSYPSISFLRKRKKLCDVRVYEASTRCYVKSRLVESKFQVPPCLSPCNQQWIAASLMFHGERRITQTVLCVCRRKASNMCTPPWKKGRNVQKTRQHPQLAFDVAPAPTRFNI